MRCGTAGAAAQCQPLLCSAHPCCAVWRLGGGRGSSAPSGMRGNPTRAVQPPLQNTTHTHSLAEHHVVGQGRQVAGVDLARASQHKLLHAPRQLAARRTGWRRQREGGNGRQGRERSPAAACTPHPGCVPLFHSTATTHGTSLAGPTNTRTPPSMHTEGCMHSSAHAERVAPSSFSFSVALRSRLRLMGACAVALGRKERARGKVEGKAS